MLSKYTNTFFPICSLVISLLITIMYFSREKIKNQETKIYSKLVITGLVESSFYVFLTILVDAIYLKGYPLLFEILNKILGTIYIVWMTLLLFYTIDVSTDNMKKKQIAKKIIILLSVIFSVIMFLLPIELYMDPILYQSNSYGLAIDFLYMALSSYIVLMVYIVIKNRNDKELQAKYLPLYILFISLSISMVLRMIDPLFNVTSNMLSLVLLIMYHTIENPDMKMIEQLESARNQADKANRAKTDFLSSMSHEIRTPLNAIVGFSDYIMSSESLDEAKENAKDIINASNTLLEIVNSILDISKIEAGKLEIINSKYDAKTTFESLAKLITPKMKEKGLDFTYYIAPDIPDALYGDPANIKKIITNILSNAYKYTDKGFVRYEVNCINNSTITKLIISVEDSGRGIKQDKIDKLFTKFQRLDEDKNTTIEGTGLGLAITKQLTELMGGKILVHTKYGEGSKFTIILSQKIENTKVKEKKQELKTTLDLTDKKILIVDDNELNLKVASKVLQRYNANNIETLDNGFDCIEKIKSKEKYDVILLDDMMPKIGGIETLKKLKELPNFNIPVVALTANAISGMKEKYLNEGFDAYIAKPIEKDELIKVMNQLLFKEAELEETEILEIIDEETIEEYEEKKQVEQPKKKITETIINSLKEQTPVVEVNELYLQENGVNLDISLEILGDMDMYNETIKDFVDIGKTKFEKIKFYKKEKDLENYAIEVHSLKSDAQHLGFVDLAELSYQHEIKSKSKDKKFIDKYFSILEDEYLRVLEVAKKYTDSLK